MNEERHFTGRSFNVYLDSEPIRHSFDSLEGLPTVTPEMAAGPASAGSPGRFYSWLESSSRVLPGLALAAALAWVGAQLADYVGRAVMGFEKSPLSPILVGVVLGLLLRNLIGLPQAFEKGLTFCVKRLLRIGVALLGLRLSLGMAGQIGLQALPIVLCSITLTLVVVAGMSRWFGVSNRLGSLIGVGTAICGVTAIMATAPAIHAKKDEIGYAVGVITLFGMVALFAYPMLAHGVFAGDATMAGYFLGTAIHDTSQVAGAGLMYQVRYGSEETLAVATTTKLVRNLMMGALIPFIAVMHQRQSAQAANKSATRLPLTQWVPLFIVGFVLMAAVRTIGDLGERPFGLMDGARWSGLLDQAGTISAVCLTLAMAAVGLGTDLKEFRRLGLRPMLVGLIAALLAGGAGYLLIRVLV